MIFLDYTGPAIHKPTIAFVSAATSTTTPQSSITCTVQSLCFVVLCLTVLSCRYDNGTIWYD